MRGMRGAALGIWVGLLVGCSPELGETPFACSTEASCPDGYACQSAVCVKEGSSLPTSHAKRSTFINSAEIFWLPRKGGGAELIVNDGFTEGSRGIYAITVDPDGKVAAPRALLPYGGEVGVSSSAIELPDGRYGIVTLSFPSFEGDDVTLTVLGIERDVPEGAAPSIETLYTDTEKFLGGSEPAYVSAIASAEDSTIDVAWTRPSEGGRVEVVRVAKQGSLWKAKKQVRQPLPPGILPLSGDCLLWKTGPDTVKVRVGYETFAVASFDLSDGAAVPSTAFEAYDGIPIYGWADDLLLLRRGAHDDATESSRVSYVVRSLSGLMKESVDDGGVIQDLIEPYTAVPAEGDAVLFGPLSSDPAFASLEIASRSPSGALTKVASVARSSTDPIYSARALSLGGKVYFAWLSFHESQMDLWAAVASSNAAGALVRPPERAASFKGAARGVVGGPRGLRGLGRRP